MPLLLSRSTLAAKILCVLSSLTWPSVTLQPKHLQNKKVKLLFLEQWPKARLNSTLLGISRKMQAQEASKCSSPFSRTVLGPILSASKPSSPSAHLQGGIHPRIQPELEPWLLSAPGHRSPCFTEAGEVTSEGQWGTEDQHMGRDVYNGHEGEWETENYPPAWAAGRRRAHMNGNPTNTLGVLGAHISGLR